MSQKVLVCNRIIVFVEKRCSFVSDTREEPTVFLVILTKEAWAVLSLDSYFKSLPNRLLRQIPYLFLVILHTVELYGTDSKDLLTNLPEALQSDLRAAILDHYPKIVDWNSLFV